MRALSLRTILWPLAVSAAFATNFTACDDDDDSSSSLITFGDGGPSGFSNDGGTTGPQGADAGTTECKEDTDCTEAAPCEKASCEGNFCHYTSTCGSDEYCDEEQNECKPVPDCVVDTDCIAQESCQNAACQNGQCVFSSACNRSNEYCDVQTNQCVHFECQSDTECNQADACETAACNDHACEYTYVGENCCSDNYACDNGLSCIGNVCIDDVDLCKLIITEDTVREGSPFTATIEFSNGTYPSNIIAEIAYGPVSGELSPIANWSFSNRHEETQISCSGDSCQANASFTAPAPGKYGVAARVSLSSNPTHFVYCDTFGSNRNDSPYNPEACGQITVTDTCDNACPGATVGCSGLNVASLAPSICNNGICEDQVALEIIEECGENERCENSTCVPCNCVASSSCEGDTLTENLASCNPDGSCQTRVIDCGAQIMECNASGKIQFLSGVCSTLPLALKSAETKDENGEDGENTNEPELPTTISQCDYTPTAGSSDIACSDGQICQSVNGSYELTACPTGVLCAENNGQIELRTYNGTCNEQGQSCSYDAENITVCTATRPVSCNNNERISYKPICDMNAQGQAICGEQEVRESCPTGQLCAVTDDGETRTTSCNTPNLTETKLNGALIDGVYTKYYDVLRPYLDQNLTARGVVQIPGYTDYTGDTLPEGISVQVEFGLDFQEAATSPSSNTIWVEGTRTSAGSDTGYHAYRATFVLSELTASMNVENGQKAIIWMRTRLNNSQWSYTENTVSLELQNPCFNLCVAGAKSTCIEGGFTTQTGVCTQSWDEASESQSENTDETNCVGGSTDTNEDCVIEQQGPREAPAQPNRIASCELETTTCANGTASCATANSYMQGAGLCLGDEGNAHCVSPLEPIACPAANTKLACASEKSLLVSTGLCDSEGAANGKPCSTRIEACPEPANPRCETTSGEIITYTMACVSDSVSCEQTEHRQLCEGPLVCRNANCQPLEIQSCQMERSTLSTLLPTETSWIVKGKVQALGLTDRATAVEHIALKGQVGLGPVNSDQNSASWKWFDAELDPTVNDAQTDTYVARVDISALDLKQFNNGSMPSSLSYAFRFSNKNGATNSWTSCGSNTISVMANDFCANKVCTAGPSGCDSDGVTLLQNTGECKVVNGSAVCVTERIHCDDGELICSNDGQTLNGKHGICTTASGIAKCGYSNEEVVLEDCAQSARIVCSADGKSVEEFPAGTCTPRTAAHNPYCNTPEPTITPCEEKTECVENELHIFNGTCNSGACVETVKACPTQGTPLACVEGENGKLSIASGTCSEDNGSCAQEIVDCPNSPFLCHDDAKSYTYFAGVCDMNQASGCNFATVASVGMCAGGDQCINNTCVHMPIVQPLNQTEIPAESVVTLTASAYNLSESVQVSFTFGDDSEPLFATNVVVTTDENGAQTISFDTPALPHNKPEVTVRIQNVDGGFSTQTITTFNTINDCALVTDEISYLTSSPTIISATFAANEETLREQPIVARLCYAASADELTSGAQCVEAQIDDHRATATLPALEPGDYVYNLQFSFNAESILDEDVRWFVAAKEGCFDTSALTESDVLTPGSANIAADYVSYCKLFATADASVLEGQPLTALAVVEDLLANGETYRTATNEAPAGLIVQLGYALADGYSSPDTNPATENENSENESNTKAADAQGWTWLDNATWSARVNRENADQSDGTAARYTALADLTDGTYVYTMRVSNDQGQHWLYCDMQGVFGRDVDRTYCGENQACHIFDERALPTVTLIPAIAEEPENN